MELFQASGDNSSMDGRVEAEDMSSSSEGASDSEVSLQDSMDDDFCSEANSSTKLQHRTVVLKAYWKDELGMAEVIEQKGRLWHSMGIVRKGKLYFSIEEILYLVQTGALLLVDDMNTAIPLKDIYSKVADERSGCSWEDFKVYQHLKSLGYIIGRHGIPWSPKNIRSRSMPMEDTPEEDSNKVQTVLHETSIVQSLKDLQIKEVKPLAEVYLPNSKFKKTSPGDPNFLVHAASGSPPSLSDIQELERRSNGLPLKIGHVDHGRVSFFSFDKVELPFLL